jgi:DNA repair protein RadC
LIIYLNNSNKLFQSPIEQRWYYGTLVDVRIVLKLRSKWEQRDFLCQSSIRDFNSSDADKQITKKLKLAGDSLEIKVLDHLIVD